MWRLPIPSLMRGLLALALLAGLLIAWDSPARGDPVRLAAQPYQFSLLAWTVEGIARQWAPLSLFVPVADREDVLEEYFRATRELGDARRAVDRLLASASPDEARRVEQRREEARAAQQRLTPLAERAIAGKISRFLTEEALGVPLPLWKPFPPVAFVFQTAPHVLVVSPRERIELVQSILLDQEMEPADAEELERLVEIRGLSALVERIGGVATFPSLIAPRSTLHDAVEAAAHEWVHHYLIFQPLGQRYWTSAEMTTLNETVADLVAAEVARRLAPHQDGSAGALDAAPEGPPFDAGPVLRETRLRVEDLLARGEIEEAEALMVERQRFLADNGVFIRKLNQAYFAFHGTYASDPASLSPIDGQLRTLRSQSPSLGAFLRRVARLRSTEGLDALLSASEPTEPRYGSVAPGADPRARLSLPPSPPGPQGPRPGGSGGRGAPPSPPGGRGSGPPGRAR